MSDIPIVRGSFVVPEAAGQKPYLIGARCAVCGYTCFPKKTVCVRCRRDDTMQEVNLGTYGDLQTFAIMRVGPPEIPAPYAIGYIVMGDNGPVVFSQITGCEMRDDALQIGQLMELVVGKVAEDEKHNNVIGWKFKPARDES